jgi:hypothetical protein
MIDKTEHEKLADLLVKAGFDGGWVLQGETLIIWEHETEPPKPLTRPKA